MKFHSLEQLGIHVELIPPETLAKNDLNRFSTIVLGIRAYDTQKEVAANNKRLLDYVLNGGTLVVQYNSGVGDFNSGKFTPYPAQASRARVSVEELQSNFSLPTMASSIIRTRLRQRTLTVGAGTRPLFYGELDNHFKPLLACNDPGESSQKGGLLRAQYGKGTYIFTGYAFSGNFRPGFQGCPSLCQPLERRARNSSPSGKTN